MSYIAPLFMAIALNFCHGARIDGSAYRSFIQNVQVGYRNEPAWSLEVQRGQKAALKQGICKNISF